MPSGICMPVGAFTTFDTEILTTAGMARLAAGAIVMRLGPSFASASLRLICADGKAAGNGQASTDQQRAQYGDASPLRSVPEFKDFTLPPGC